MIDTCQDLCEQRWDSRSYERVTVCTPWGSAYLTRECVDRYPDLLKGMVCEVLELALCA